MGPNGRFPVTSYIHPLIAFYMRKFTLLFVFVIAAASLAAQKKSLSYDQAFKNASFDLLKQLPSQVQWVDDEHYTVYSRDAGGSWSWQLVEVKTGKTVPNTHPPEQETMIRPGDRQPASEKRNVTVSADGKWVGIYKKR